MKIPKISNAWYGNLVCWGCLACAVCPTVGLLASLSALEQLK